MERFQTYAIHGGYLGYFSPAGDVGAFLEVVKVWFGEPDHEDSWFHNHANRHIHSVHFTCKANDKIMFYMIFFKIFVLYENV